MKRWQLTSVMIVLFAAGGGCKSHYLRSANEALERENFLLEQRCDDLTFRLEDAQNELEMYRRGREAGPTRATTPTYAPRKGTPPREQAAPPIDSGPSGGDDMDAPPNVELPSEETRIPSARRRREPVPRFIGPPVISPPDPSVPEGTLREDPGNKETQDTASQADRDGTDTPQGHSPEPAGAARLIGQGSGHKVTALAVNAKLTVWRKLPADSPEKEELRVVVEPRDSSGRIVEPEGVVAIVVLDPALEGPAARLARWDFTAEEVAERFQGIASGGGLHFQLSWPEAAPTVDKLLLFVRLTTPAGEQLVSEYELQPAGEEDSSSAWTSPEQHHRSAARSVPKIPARGWERATTPLPPRPPAPKIAPPAAEPAPEIVPEAAAPEWAPYR